MDTGPYQARLEEEKGKLEAELATIGRRNPSNPADWEAVPGETGQEADRNDAADLIEGFEANTAILKDLEARYNEVLAALARIENGTYGVCSVGGEAIEPERLAADPAAKTCKAHINN
jgi:RNA polymerase-binding transcription factor DksA